MTQDFRITQGASAASAATVRTTAKPAATASFASELQQAELRFSNHAQKRLEKRDIALSSDDIARLSLAVDSAAKRGGKDSLVLMDDMAFVVNVRDRLVVTAVDAKSRGEGVFTQIDSVVLAK